MFVCLPDGMCVFLLSLLYVCVYLPDGVCVCVLVDLFVCVFVYLMVCVCVCLLDGVCVFGLGLQKVVAGFRWSDRLC